MRGVQEGARAVYAAGRQVIYTAIGIAAAIAALELHFRGEERFARWALGERGEWGFFCCSRRIFARPRRGR